jgi:NAD(P)H-dependent FMN reductase
MLRIAIVTGTRPGRLNEAVARWILDAAHRRADAHVSLVDISAYGLFHAEDVTPGPDPYAPEHLRAWSRTVESLDGFVFVTPEYNHASSSALRSAIDTVAGEWRNKAAGFVGYGAQGAVRAVEDLRQALAAAGVATVAPQVSLTLVPDFGSGSSSFAPDPRHAAETHALLEQVISWARALKAVRAAMRHEPGSSVALAPLPAQALALRAR